MESLGSLYAHAVHQLGRRIDNKPGAIRKTGQNLNHTIPHVAACPNQPKASGVLGSDHEKPGQLALTDYGGERDGHQLAFTNDNLNPCEHARAQVTSGRKADFHKKRAAVRISRRCNEVDNSLNRSL